MRRLLPRSLDLLPPPLLGPLLIALLEGTNLHLSSKGVEPCALSTLWLWREVVPEGVGNLRIGCLCLVIRGTMLDGREFRG